MVCAQLCNCVKMYKIIIKIVCKKPPSVTLSYINHLLLKFYCPRGMSDSM